MNDDNAPKKSWTSPTLEMLGMASTAGGDAPMPVEDTPEDDGARS